MATKKENTEVPKEAASEAPAEAPAQTTQPAKKSNTTLIIVLVLVVIFVVLPMIGIFGAGLLVKKKVNDISKGNFSLSDGNTSVKVGENQSWPGTIPSTVPKFTDGKIQASSKVGKDWSMTISEVTVPEYNAYKTNLVSKGWTIESETNLGGFQSWTAVKGNYRVNASFTPSDNAMVLGVTESEATE